jgi:Caspase domain
MVAAAEMGGRVKLARLIALGCICLVAAAIPARASTYYVTVAGLGGEPDYVQQFTALASDLDKLLKGAGPDAHVFTLSGAQATREQMTQALQTVAREAKPDDDFVLILIGHGTYDGATYKFNLVGPDITGKELAELCDRIPAKRQLIINTTEASGASVVVLERPGRGVIAATKNGLENNATVFARYFVQALHDPDADLDKDQQISALEAFEYAERKTATFYEEQKRLATEHAIFEDTGTGEPAREASGETREGRLLSTFTLMRLGTAQIAAANNPATRALMAKKEDLERKIDILKYQKAAMPEDEYKRELTAALLELARVQEQLDK